MAIIINKGSIHAGKEGATTTPHKGGAGMENFTDHLKAESPKGTVITEKKSKGMPDYAVASSHVHSLSVPQTIPAHEMLKIELRCGKTVNLGNYESARVDIAITVPTTKADLEDAYEFAVQWVDVKMKEALEDSE